MGRRHSSDAFALTVFKIQATPEFYTGTVLGVTQILPSLAQIVKGPQYRSHDKRMNDCLPPILFSAIFKLLKVLPDTELDAC